MVNTKITGKELNDAYTKIQELKKGLDRNLPAYLWINDREVEFRFDNTVGYKGAWILSSTVDIDFEDDNEFDSTIEGDIETYLD